MSYSLGQSEDSDLKSVTAFAEQTSLTEWSDGSIEVSTPKVVVSSQYRSRFSVYSQQGISSPYIVVSRADAQSRGVPILADPWSAYQAGQKLPGPMAAQVKASGIPIPQEGRRWIPWAIVGGGMMLAVSALYFFGAKKVKPNSRRSSGRNGGRGGRRSTFIVRSVERIREGTYKVSVDLGRDGEIRVIVYPDPLPMQVLSDGPVQWLESDLSSAQRKKITAAVTATKKMNPNSRRSSGKKPVTKHGAYGTLYLYEIEFDEGGDPDPGEPPWMSKTKLYGYDRDHAIERFYDSYYGLNPGNSTVKIKSATRVMRYPK